MKHPLTRLFLLAVISCGIAPLSASQVSLSANPPVEARVDALEKRLEAIERKFRLLCDAPEPVPSGGTNSSGAFGSASQLLAQARLTLEKKESPERAYRYLATLRALYPGSPEDREAFALATGLYKHLYYQNRLREPQGIWTTVESVFMFQWLTTFFPESQGEFPMEQAQLLLVGTPGNFLRDFEAFGANNPKLRRWRIQAERDNGIIQAITPHLTQP